MNSTIPGQGMVSGFKGWMIVSVAKLNSYETLQGMTNDDCRLTNVGLASLNRFQIDRSTKDSRQTEYIIRCSMLDVRCSTFISFLSLIRPAVL